MHRRKFLVWSAAAGLNAPLSKSADERTEILEAVEPLAAALSSSDAGLFLARIAPDAPNRQRLADNLAALLAMCEITSSVELLSSDSGRAQLDWYMQLRLRVTATLHERRRAKVTVRIRAKKIQELDPIDFFRPPQL